MKKLFLMFLLMSCLFSTQKSNANDVLKNPLSVNAEKVNKYESELVKIGKDVVEQEKNKQKGNADNLQEINDATFSREFFKITGLFTLIGIIYGVVRHRSLFNKYPEYFKSPLNLRSYFFFKQRQQAQWQLTDKTLVTVFGLVRSVLPSLIQGVIIALASRVGTWKKLKNNDLFVHAILWFLATSLLSHSAFSFTNLSTQDDLHPLAEIRAPFSKAIDVLKDARLVSVEGARLYRQDLDRELQALQNDPERRESIFSAVFADKIGRGCRILFSEWLALSIVIQRYIRTRHSLKKDLEEPVVATG